MNERLRKLRQTLGLNQEEFSKKIGVTRSAISRLESGDINFTEQMLKSICREFNVDYLWLKNGIGEMFTNIPETILDELALHYNLSEDEAKIVQEFVSLDKEKRQVLMSFLRNK